MWILNPFREIFRQVIRRIRGCSIRKNTGFLWFFDSFICNSNGIYLAGWAFGKKSDLGNVFITFLGNKQKIYGNSGLKRDDVFNAYPDLPFAQYSGFFVFGSLPKTQFGKIILHLILKNGTHKKLSLKVPENQIETITTDQEKEIIEWLKLTEYPRCLFIVDHSMGGGSNIYRNNLVSKELNSGSLVVLLTFVLNSLSFRIVVMKQNMKHVAILREKFDDILPIISMFRPDSILVNCLVSFPDPLNLFSIIGKIREQSQSGIIVAIHDYLPICPSNHLLNYQGGYCDIPDIAVCKNCLRNNETGFVSMTRYHSQEHWRKRWRDFLHTANEITCFSESSVKLMLKVFPDLHGRIILRPHEVRHLQKVKRDNLPTDILRIAIVGAITFQKGAEVLSELVQAIQKTNAPLRIVIIGTTDFHYPGNIVKITGLYSPDELPELIKKNRVSIVLLPSICPETFSFVCHEVISMEMPLMVFNLGAQAETVRKYHLGRVVEKSDGLQLLSDIQNFAKSIDTENPV